MERKRQREITLGVAVLAIALSAYRLLTFSPSSDVISSPVRSTPAAVTATKSASPQGLTEVDLSALDAPKAEPQAIVRNPFRFKPKPPPPPPPGPIRPSTPQDAGPVGPLPPPPIPLKFFGYFEIPGTGLVANLTDGRGIYRGKVGDTIEGRYRILRIGVESIDIAYLDGRGRQTIRLNGQ
jgi:hypothetical protein